MKTFANLRKPVERRNSARFMLIMVVSLAVTVMATRVYLELTGYPQLGNTTFHFAHALWGGLFQVIAAALILVYFNEWIITLGAVLAGVGAGLFIDEIGKFITQTNDYFFPLAAPIIYVALILGVLIYLLVRREEARDARAEMYLVLDELKLLADDRLDAVTRAELANRLQTIADQSERPDLAVIAQGLLHSLPVETPTAPAELRGISRLVKRWEQIEARRFTRGAMRRALVIFFLVFGTLSLVEIIVLLAVVLDRDTLSAPLIMDLVQSNPLIRSPYSFNWYMTLMTIEAIVGLLYLVALVAFLRQRDQIATQAGSLGLILSLTVANTLAFYFNQFSVAANSAALLIVLVMVTRYRDRFLRDASAGQT